MDRDVEFAPGLLLRDVDRPIGDVVPLHAGNVASALSGVVEQSHGKPDFVVVAFQRQFHQRFGPRLMLADVQFLDVPCRVYRDVTALPRSAEHTSELPPLMRISSAVFCLTKKKY